MPTRTRTQRTTADATPVLTAFVVVLLAIPAAMRMTALGSAGSPATLVALTLFLWWLWFHVQRDQPLPAVSHPVRSAMLAWVLVVTVAYVHSMSIPLPYDERSPADNGLLRILALAGVLLVVNDGIGSLERLHALVRRLVVAAGLMALLGLVQYATQQLWVDRLVIPGFPQSSDLGLAARSGLVRPSGTATHPIEFGVVMTMVLPLAITCARTAVRRRWAYWAIVFAISFGVLLSISRSAIICGVVGLTVLLSSWPLVSRLKALLFLLALLTVAFLTVPGLLGTLMNLFTRIASDSSVSSRTGSYGVAMDFIERSPWIGRGAGTFLPKYRILDNGYLGVVVETGVIGLAALLAVIVTGFLAARRAMRLARADVDRNVAAALSASIAAGGAALPFFDTFAFPQSAGCLVLALGLSGALRRLLTVGGDGLEGLRAAGSAAEAPQLSHVRAPLLRRSGGRSSTPTP